MDEQWRPIRGGPDTVTEAFVDSVAARFTVSPYDAQAANDPDDTAALAEANPSFRRWLRGNVHPHRVPGYVAVTASLKAPGRAPGDITAEQMETMADLADRYGFGELRVSHEQNLILADVRRSGLFALWQDLGAAGLATPNIGKITNIIACPGGDFCALANAVSIPLAQAIHARFDDLDHVHDIGELDLNISGCINACGHHHIGHIGILGVDKAGEAWYQITLGGRQNGAGGPEGSDSPAAIGRIIGPSFAQAQVPDVIERLIDTYLAHRDSDAERFVDVVGRIGIEPFQAAVYPDAAIAARRSHAEVAHGGA